MASGAFYDWVMTQLSRVGTLTGNERFWCAQGGQSKYITLDDIAGYAGGGGIDSDSFGIIRVAGQQDVIADQPGDVVTFVAGSNITITTNAAGDTVTINASGGGGPVTVSWDEIEGDPSSNADLVTLLNQYKSDIESGIPTHTGDLINNGSGGGSPFLTVVEHTFGNLTGNVADNNALVTALNGKISVSTLGAANGTAQLGADGKLRDDQIPTALLGQVSYQGGWNASTNSPTLTSGVGTKGHYYIVTADGSTPLNGITDWKTGDWAIYNGTAWQKVDNTDAVITVNGYIGAVVLKASDLLMTGFSAAAGTVAAGDTILQAINKIVGNATALAATVAALTTTAIAEGTNQYFTVARVRATQLATLTLTNAAIVVNDTYEAMFGKLQAQINAILAAGPPAKRVQAATTASSLTPDFSAKDIYKMTAQVGALSIVNPSANTTDGALVELWLKCAANETLTFGNKYVGTNDTQLPLTTTGSGKWDFYGFKYEATSGNYYFVAKNTGG